jgi:hypothetical protein
MPCVSWWHGVSQTQMQSSRCWQMPPRSCVARAVRASCGGRGCASLAGGATCLAPAPLFCGCQELIGSDFHEVLACFCAGVEIFECSASPRRRHPRQSVPGVPFASVATAPATQRLRVSAARVRLHQIVAGAYPVNSWAICCHCRRRITWVALDTARARPPLSWPFAALKEEPERRIRRADEPTLNVE